MCGSRASSINGCPSESAGPNVTEAIKQVVPTLALVVVGGPARRWWPTVEQRLADRLRRHGRNVVFVQERASDRARPDGGLNGSLEASQLPRRASVHPLRGRRSDVG